MTCDCKTPAARERAILMAELREDARDKIWCTIAALGAVRYVCFSLHLTKEGLFDSHQAP